MIDPGESSRLLLFNQQSYSHGAGFVARAVDGDYSHFVKSTLDTNGRLEDGLKNTLRLKYQHLSVATFGSSRKGPRLCNMVHMLSR